MSEDDLDPTTSCPFEAGDESNSWLEFEVEQEDIAHAFGAGTPRSPRAAFRFGHLVRQVRLDHSTFWANPDVANIRELLYTYHVDGSIDLIRRMGKSLAGEFVPQSLSEVDRALAALEKHTHDLITSWASGMRMTIPIHAPDPAFEPIWQDFRGKADSALLPDSPLRGLYDAGSGIGDYQVRLLPLRAVTDGVLAPGPLPDLGPLLRSLHKLLPVVIVRSPLLGEVVRLDSTSASQCLERFVELVNTRRPIGRPMDDPLGLSIALRYLYNSVSNGLNGLDFETIAPPRRLWWNVGPGKLILDGEVIRSVAANAKNLRCLLDAFEQLGWPNQIDNPLPKFKQDDPQLLHQAVKEMNRNLRRIRFGVGGGATIVHWTIL